MGSYRAPKAPGTLVLRMMQSSSQRGGEILIVEKERESKERGTRTNERGQAPCQNSKTRSIRDEREMVTAQPRSKYLRSWLYPEQT